MKKALILTVLIICVFLMGARVYDKKGNYIGKVENGRIYDRDGRYTGKIENDRVYDDKGFYKYKIENDSKYYPQSPESLPLLNQNKQ